MLRVALIAGLILAVVFVVDTLIKRGFRRAYLQLAWVLAGLTALGAAYAMFARPQILAGALAALAAANVAGLLLRARALAKRDAEASAPAGEIQEAPYEQFVNNFLGYFETGSADALEFEFVNWRMEIRFKQGDEILPAIHTPFHILLQIKRIFDAATVKNPKTGEARMRYIARGTLYEFLSEEIGGTKLRLTMISRRAAAEAEQRAFDRIMKSVR